MKETTKYKHCKCPKVYWEIIIVDFDENYGGKTTVYHHCDFCGEDFAIVDFETEEIIFENNGTQ